MRFQISRANFHEPTLCVIHIEGSRHPPQVVQDVMRGWRSSRTSKVDLEGIVAEIAGVLKGYRIREVHGDEYAAGWVRQAFERHGVRYRDPGLDRSGAYLEAEREVDELRLPELDAGLGGVRRHGRPPSARHCTDSPRPVLTPEAPGTLDHVVVFLAEQLAGSKERVSAFTSLKPPAP